MKVFVVWLDSKSARVFTMNPSGQERVIVSKSEKDHHTRHRNDKHQDSQAEHYYSEVAKKLKNASQILLMGPGLAKNHFQDYLNTHEAGTLAKKVIGLEKMESFEHKSENQMMVKAHQFFRTYNLFHPAI